MIFGTAKNQSQAAASLGKEFRSRLVQFTLTSQPNPPDTLVWPRLFDEDQLNLLLLGQQRDTLTGISTIAKNHSAEACTDVWGDKVPFDWQMYSA